MTTSQDVGKFVSLTPSSDPEGSRKLRSPDFMTTSQDVGKFVSLTPSSDPEGSRKLRSPDFMTTSQDVGKFVSLTHRPLLPPRNTPGTHFY